MEPASVGIDLEALEGFEIAGIVVDPHEAAALVGPQWAARACRLDAAAHSVRSDHLGVPTRLDPAV